MASDILDPYSYLLLQSLQLHPHLRQFPRTIDFYGRVDTYTTARILETLPYPLSKHHESSTIPLQRTIPSASRIPTLTLRFSEGIANSEWQTRRSERVWSTDPETKDEDEHASFLYLLPTIPSSVRHLRLPYRIEPKQKKCFLKAFEQRGPILAPSLKAVTTYTRQSTEKVRRKAMGSFEDEEERRRKKRWEYRVEHVLEGRGIACRWVIERWEKHLKDREFHGRVERRRRGARS